MTRSDNTKFKHAWTEREGVLVSTVAAEWRSKTRTANNVAVILPEKLAPRPASPRRGLGAVVVGHRETADFSW